MHYTSDWNSNYRGYHELKKIYLAISVKNTEKSFSIGAVSNFYCTVCIFRLKEIKQIEF